MDGKPPPHFLPSNSMKTLQLNISSREGTGGAAARKLRGQGRIPAVIYGGGNSRLCSVARKDFEIFRKSVAGSASLVELAEEGGASVLTLVKDVHRHVINRQFLHIDFQEVDKDRELTTTVPVLFTGESIGVRQNDGILQHQVTEISVRCRPADLPGMYELDVSEMDLNDSLSVRDLSDFPGVTVLIDENQTIVTCSGSAHGRAEAEFDDEEVGEEGEDESGEGESDKSGEESGGES